MTPRQEVILQPIQETESETNSQVYMKENKIYIAMYGLTLSWWEVSGFNRLLIKGDDMVRI